MSYLAYNLGQPIGGEYFMPEQFTFSGDIVWRPTQEYIERAHLTAFMREHGIRDFND